MRLAITLAPSENVSARFVPPTAWREVSSDRFRHASVHLLQSPHNKAPQPARR
jgi:hypothetical protein